MKRELVGDPLKVLKPYLGNWDIPEGGDLVLTIDEVYVDEVKNQRGSEDKPIIRWMERDAKPMILNKTNRDTITKLYGRRTETNTWHGAKIALYAAEEPKSPDGLALRIRPRKPKGAAFLCADCGLEITGHGTRPAIEVAEGTRSKYGVTLCWDCAMKRKGASDEQ